MCPGLESANVNGSGAGKQHFNNSRLVLRGDADEGSYHSVGISACKTTGGWHTPITTQHRIRFVFKRCCKRRRPKASVETAAPLASCNGLGACWPEDADRLTELLRRAGEDPLDPGGYFIINGSEKVVIAVQNTSCPVAGGHHSRIVI